MAFHLRGLKKKFGVCFNMVCVSNKVALSASVGALCVLTSGVNAYSNAEDALTRRRVLAASMRTCGALAFPPLLFSLLRSEDAGCSACILPLLWHAAITLIDQHLLFRAPSNDLESKGAPASVRMDPNCVAGLAFGLCGYLNARNDHPYGHVFLYAIVGSVACVLPTHNLAPGCIEHQVIESFQKSALFACISLVIAGVCLVRSAPGVASR